MVAIIYDVYAIHAMKTYNTRQCTCSTYSIPYRIDAALSMKSITAVWPPPKAAATPLLWTRAPKAPAPWTMCDLLRILHMIYITSHVMSWDILCILCIPHISRVSYVMYYISYIHYVSYIYTSPIYISLSYCL